MVHGWWSWQAVNLRWAFFGMFWTYVDCALIGMTLAAIMLATMFGLAASQLASKISQLDTDYLDFYTLASARYKFDVARAGVLFLAWIKVRPLCPTAVYCRD